MKYEADAELASYFILHNFSAMPLVEVKSSNRDLLRDQTSGLSRRLAAGELDPREVLVDINRSLARRTLSAAETAYLEGVKRQLIFREFARSALEAQTYKFPPGAYGKSSSQHELLLSGATGIPLIDACLRDLKGGLPHNRARLLLARFAIRNLNLVPELVADFYRQHLADYSPVINTFNIVSAASGAVFGEPWFRLSNPVTAAKRLDPDNGYIARFGFSSQRPTDAGAALIRDGNQLWATRWKSAQQSGEYIRRQLWPTHDVDRGIYFILNRSAARGAFAPYYQAYLKREGEFLST
jgi:hypothetical protein